MTDCSFPEEKSPFFYRHTWLVSFLILIGLVLFGVSTYSLVTHKFLYVYDQIVSAYFVPLGKSLPGWLMTGLIWLANIGSVGPTLISVGFAYYWLRKRCDDRFLLILLSYAMGLVIFWVLADLFNRQRPDLPGLLSAMPFPSYPSGHMIQTITLLATLLYLYLPKVTSSGKRITWLLLAVGYVILIALDRLITNAHYLTDVLAGVGIGLLWSLMVLVVFERVHLRRLQT